MTLEVEPDYAAVFRSVAEQQLQRIRELRSQLDDVWSEPDEMQRLFLHDLDATIEEGEHDMICSKEPAFERE